MSTVESRLPLPGTGVSKYRSPRLNKSPTIWWMWSIVWVSSNVLYKWIKRHLWKSLAVATSVIVVSIAGWWHLSRPKEPQYKGKTVSEWMNDVGRCGTHDAFGIQLYTLPVKVFEDHVWPKGDFVIVINLGTEQARDEARSAIQHIGTNAIPFIEPMLLKHDWVIRSHLDRWIHKWPWLERQFPPTVATRQRAMAAMLYLEKGTVPFLIRLYRDESTPNDVRTFAAYTFQIYPKESKEALLALKQGKSSSDPYLAYLSRSASETIQRQIDFDASKGDH